MRRSRNSLVGYKYMFKRIFNLLFNKIDLTKPYKENKFSQCFNSIPLTSIKNKEHLLKLTNNCSQNGYPFILSMHQWELKCFQPKSEIKYSELLKEIIMLLNSNYELINFHPKASSIK